MDELKFCEFFPPRKNFHQKKKTTKTIAKPSQKKPLSISYNPNVYMPTIFQHKRKKRGAGVGAVVQLGHQLRGIAPIQFTNPPAE